jgi:hypothetical protein
MLKDLPTDRLAVGVHLFTQYSYLIISVTCVFYIHERLGAYFDLALSLSKLYAESALMVVLAISVVTLGLGATLMLTLSAQESFTPVGRRVGGKMTLQS